MRLLTSITMIFMLVTLSWQTRAASMGDIDVHSGLNQPLKAYIPIKLNNPGERSSLKVTLAQDQGFSNGDLIAPPDDLTIKLDTHANDEPIVLLTTRKAIVEPAFSIFVLLETSAGRLLREYTLLLDLPNNTEKVKIVQATQTESADAVEKKNDRLIYVPVRNETLWSIADKLKPDGKTSTQVMIKAIADINPSAFNAGNINNLKSGYELKIPTASAIASISQDAALAFIKEQDAQWRNLVNSGMPKESDTIQPPVIEQVTPVVVEPVSSITDNDNEKQALLSRIVLLEAQLNAMETLLNNVEDDKNADEMTRHEGPIGADNNVVSPAITSLPDLQSPVEIEESKSATETSTITNNSRTAETAPTLIKNLSTDKAAPLVITTPISTTEEQGVLDKLASFDGVIDLIIENNYVIAMGAGLLLLIGVLITYRAKHNAEKMASHAVSVVPAVNMQNVANDPMNVTDSVRVDDSSESESLDRLVEIDVYLAYGRHKEAEALANEGIAEDPARTDYYLKLFEVYKASDNKEAFETEAESFFSQLSAENPGIWSKVVEMGKEICPNHPLFISSTTKEESEWEVENSSGNMDAFLDESIDSASSDVGDKQPAQDINLNSISPSEYMPSEVDIVEADKISSVNEYEVTDASPIEDTVKVNEVSEDAFLRDEVSDLQDSDNNAIDFSVEDKSYRIKNGIDDESQMSMSDDFIIDSGAAEFINGDINNLLKEDDFTDNDPMADLNDTVAALEEIENQGDEFSFDQEAVETKLDLVRAYIEMDDQNEARRILDEIISEGNSEQKSEAEALIRQIA